MTNCVALTNKEAFVNTKLLEKYESLHPEDVYGFGVNGNRFKFTKRDDSILTRIWFSVLKFFGFIKTDDLSIGRLKQLTTEQTSSESYQEWQRTHLKVTKLGIKHLFEENAQLKQQISEEKEAEHPDLAAHLSTINRLQHQLDSTHAEKAKLEQSIKDLSVQMRDLNSGNNRLEKELTEEKKRAEKSKVRGDRYKEKHAKLKNEVNRQPPLPVSEPVAESSPPQPAIESEQSPPPAPAPAPAHAPSAEELPKEHKHREYRILDMLHITSSHDLHSKEAKKEPAEKGK